MMFTTHMVDTIPAHYPMSRDSGSCSALDTDFTPAPDASFTDTPWTVPDTSSLTLDEHAP